MNPQSKAIAGERVEFTPGAVMGFEFLPYLIPPQVAMDAPIEDLLADDDFDGLVMPEDVDDEG